MRPFTPILPVAMFCFAVFPANGQSSAGHCVRIKVIKPHHLRAVTDPAAAKNGSLILETGAGPNTLALSLSPTGMAESMDTATGLTAVSRKLLWMSDTEPVWVEEGKAEHGVTRIRLSRKDKSGPWKSGPVWITLLDT